MHSSFALLSRAHHSDAIRTGPRLALNSYTYRLIFVRTSMEMSGIQELIRTEVVHPIKVFAITVSHRHGTFRATSLSKRIIVRITLARYSTTNYRFSTSILDSPGPSLSGVARHSTATTPSSEAMSTEAARAGSISSRQGLLINLLMELSAHDEHSCLLGTLPHILNTPEVNPVVE